MVKWHPYGWRNPYQEIRDTHIMADVVGCKDDPEIFEMGANAMLEALRNDSDCRIEVLSSRWADEARHWAFEHNLTIVLIPNEREVEANDLNSASNTYTSAEGKALSASGSKE